MPPGQPLSRREVLRRGAGAVAALGGGAVLAGCGRPPASSSAGPPSPGSTTSTSVRVTPVSAAGWAALAATLQGTVVRPTDPAYATDKQLYNERFDGIDPAAIAYCASSSDVQRCLDFGRRHGLAVAARSGGHSYGGYSSTDGGLVIDVTSLASVQVGAGDQTATVGAGARLVDVYHQLGDVGLALPGGSCPTVGIAGLALGGGIGVFGRLYGLTCDHIASLQLVTADARLLTCSPDRNEDLYWACRGGGGGNFGVVTEFVFDVHPVPAIALFTLTWPFSAAADVLGSWLQWIGGTPDELWSNCQLLSGGGAATLELRVTGVFAGTTTACSAALAPLLSAVGTAPSYNFVGPEAYERAMLIEAGCENDSVAQCHLPSQNPAGVLDRAAFAAKSAYVTAPLSNAAVTSVVATLETLAMANELAGLGGGFVFDSYGGAINRVPAGATAFVHRDALCAIEYSVNWSTGTPTSTVTAAEQWLAGAQAVLAPVTHGAYQNYIDPTQPDWLKADYGSNLSRLVSVKRSVDPDDVFHFAQSIPTRL